MTKPVIEVKPTPAAPPMRITIGQTGEACRVKADI